MVLTLDNGQAITIYEDGNFLREIQPYIDKEIYDALYDKYNDVESDLIRLDKLEDEVADKDEAYDSLEIDLDSLRDRYDNLYEENKELEQIKDKILDEISGLSYELSEDNIEEIKSKLQDLYYKY